jgi:hypothetical protein
MKYTAPLLAVMTFFTLANRISIASSDPISDVLRANYGEVIGHDQVKPELKCKLKVWNSESNELQLYVVDQAGNTNVAYPGIGGWFLDVAHTSITFGLPESPSVKVSYDQQSLRITNTTTNYEGRSAACDF